MNYKKLKQLLFILNVSPEIFCFNPVKEYSLTFDEAAYLFHPKAYHKSHRSGKDVAKRIKYFIHSKGNVRKNTKAWKREYL